MQPKIHKLQMAIVAIILAVSCGCSEAPKVDRPGFPLPEDVKIVDAEPGQYGGTFVIDWGEPLTFNFLVPGSYATSVAGSMLFDGLVTTDPFTLEVIPALAKSWEIAEDKRTYTFHLRRGLRFSDGEPLTADDVIFTFDCIFDERYPNRYAHQYTIDGKPLQYEKVDEYTVRFITPDIFSPFLINIGWADIWPEHILRPFYESGELLMAWSGETARLEPASIVGTGPFKIQKYSPGEHIVFQPNPHYWKADREGQRLPYIDNFVWQFVNNTNARKVNFFSGQSDSLEIGASDTGWLEENAGLHNYTIYDQGPSTGIGFFWFNLNPGLNPQGEPYVDPVKLKWFSDKRFRQAILYGFDRKGLAEGPFLGMAQPLHSIISPANTTWHNPNVRHYPYNPEKAKALLRAMGFALDDDGNLRDSDGNPVEFRLMVTKSDSPQAEALYSTLRKNLRALGIELTITFVDFGTLVKNVNNTFDYEFSMLGFTGGGDPSGGKAIYSSEGRLHTWHPQQEEPATPWEARIDEIMVEQERTFDKAKRQKLFFEMQEIFSEELPLLYTLTPNAFVGFANKWQNKRIPSPAVPAWWNIEELWEKQ